MSKKFHEVGKYLLNLYVLFLFIIMPLFIKNYNYVASDKWQFYSYISFGYSIGKIFIPGFLLLIGLCLIIEVIFFKYEIKFDRYDLFILLFGIVVFISGKCALGSYFATDVSQVVIGYPGWYMGLASKISFMLIYFYIKQYWSNNKKFFDLIIVISSLIFFLAILNRFDIDVFGFWNSVNYETKQLTVSTMGNINWYACYLVLHLPLSIYSYLYFDNKVLYGIAFSIGICTLVSNGSDSGFLVLICILYILIRREDNASLIELFMIGSGSCCVLGILQRIIGSAYIPSTLSRISTLSIVPWLILVISIFLYFKKDVYVYFKKIVVIGFPIVLILIIVYMILNSLGALPDSLRSYGYLYFNDSWGNNRGIIWRMGIESFIKLVKERWYVLFVGCGPDQYYNMVYKYQYYELVEMGNGIYASCAHNEFINTLCNYGLLGFISLYGFIFMLLKNRSGDVYGKMLSLMIIAYLTNSVVSIEQIIAAPLLFGYMGMLSNGDK